MTSPSYLEGPTFGSQDGLPKTRAGYPVYSGIAHRFKEWQFKISNRMRKVKVIKDKAQRVPKLAAALTSIIDAPTDDALKTSIGMTEQFLHTSTEILRNFEIRNSNELNKGLFDSNMKQ